MLTKPVDQIAEAGALKAKATLKEMKEGNISGLEIAEGVTLKEMIGTDSGAEEFYEKVSLEAYQVIDRHENHPLYTPFYAETVDASLPKTLTIEEMGPYGIVFLEHLEGSEVKFGTLEPGQQKVIQMTTYAAGLEYTEDMVLYNEFFRVTEQAQAMARAYIALTNYGAFEPIVAGAYTKVALSTIAEQKEAQEGLLPGETPVAQLVEWNTSVQQTLRDAISILPAATYVLCNSGDRIYVEDALAGAMLPDLRPSAVKRQLLPENIITWDGFKSRVGAKTYEFPGITSGTIFLVSGAKTNFKLYWKQKLTITQADGDMSRLILSQVIARFRLAGYAAIGGQDGAVKIGVTSP